MVAALYPQSSPDLTPFRVAFSAISSLPLLELRPVVLRHGASTSRKLLAIRAHLRRALGLLGPLVGLDLLAGGLALEAERGDRAGQEPLEPDRLAALLTFVDLAGVQPRHRLADLAEQEGLAVVEPELGGIGLLLRGLVHRVPADPVAVAVHREVEGRVGVVPQAAEVGLQARSELFR